MLYQNGNRLIDIDPYTGKKKRYVAIKDKNSIYEPELPESLDINLSYYCELGCPYCYLGANKGGRQYQFDRNELDRIFYFDISGMEVALNFNHGQDFEMTKKVVEYLRDRGAVPNITVNYRTFVDFKHKIRALGAYHIGISVESLEQITTVNQFIYHDTLRGNVVFHIINGIFPKESFVEIRRSKILILGYKEIGRGKKFVLGIPIEERFLTPEDLTVAVKHGNIIGLDNLAIRQIHPEINEKYYLGDDGEISFYLDLVTHKFGISSTSPVRWDIGEMCLAQMFNFIRKQKEV